jgi:hypothetical protein
MPTWAYPTGKRSGLLVLDVDPRNGGPQSLVALERENVPLLSMARAKSAVQALLRPLLGQFLSAVR